MPTIARIGAIQIRLYYEDHGIPHFHAISPNFDYKFAISDQAVISGNGRLTNRERSAIRRWAERHQDALNENWRRARNAETLQNIED